MIYRKRKTVSQIAAELGYRVSQHQPRVQEERRRYLSEYRHRRDTRIHQITRINIRVFVSQQLILWRLTEHMDGEHSK